LRNCENFYPPTNFTAVLQLSQKATINFNKLAINVSNSACGPALIIHVHHLIWVHDVVTDNIGKNHQFHYADFFFKLWKTHAHTNAHV